ncbi:adenine phosphoribosyltransferase [Actinopolyspora lacussalsi subsp. righensis]|uniref:Adenine phosphoribosyltransferase n=1 Tax=Actinopolyspora righensis TaxID=995060 RepID=A0A1I7C302_9ACTN|nr:adenine phosphoribosyltransferase [Actinopolyspora righensis]SFT93789.1 adenine phosphoribosyltransferase [Actinopolyspora righensis]
MTVDFGLKKELEEQIRVFPDFPKQGILFQDLTPVFQNPETVNRLAESFISAFDGKFDRVLAVEARGFILGTAVSAVGGRPLALARKKGKLPGEVHRADYSLEYGTATLEVQQGTLKQGDQVLVVDDLLATGGTLSAAGELVVTGGAKVAGYAVAATIEGLDGAERLSPTPVFSVV